MKKIVSKENSVAKIGDTYYATLKEAFAAAPTDGTAVTIEMLGNVETNEAMMAKADTNITFDLGGYTLTSKGIDMSGITYSLQNNGNLVVKNGSIVSNAMVAVAQLGGTLELNNITITNDNSEDKYCIDILANKSMAIGNGVELNGKTAIKASGKDTVITINGGTINGTLDQSTNSGVVSGNFAINGGTFSVTPNEEFLADGANVYQLENGKYVVTNAVCKIGDKYYATLQEAVDAIADNVTPVPTIELLCDVTTNERLYITRNAVIDLGGHTLNVNAPLPTTTSNADVSIQVAAALTLKNGTLVSDDYSAIACNASGSLALENLTVQHNGSRADYVGGTPTAVLAMSPLVINDGVSITSDGIALYAGSTTFTINGGEINGGLNAYNATISITGKVEGAFTTDPTPYLAEGHTVGYGANGKYYIDAVAAIGDKGYPTLGSACAAAGENDTVYLLCDYQDDTLNISDKSVKVNLGGYTLSRPTNSGVVFAVANGGSLELENGILDGKNVATTNSLVTIEGASAFKATDVTFQNAQARWGTIFAGDTSSIELIRCIIKDNVAANGERCCGSAIHAYGVVKLTDCTIKDNTETLAMTNAESISSALHLKSSVTLYLSGNNYIYDNKLSDGTQANIALTADKENTVKTVIYVTGSLEGSKIGVTENEWSNPIASGSNYTLTEADAACFVDDAGVKTTKLANNTVIFAALDENTAFETTTDSGYYGEYGTPTSGIIAFNSFLNAYKTANVGKFGLYLYVTADNQVELEAQNASALKDSAGKFFATVSEIDVDNFDTKVFAKPYVVIDGVVYYGEVASATVNANKWLGENK